MGLIAVGVVLLYFGGRADLWKKHLGLQALVNSLGGLLVVSTGLGLLWELVGKRSFAREVLETARTSTDVDAAGITRIGIDYLQEPDWAALFATVRKLDIFVAYARTWRNQHLQRLQKIAQTPGARLRVFLPDPNDPDTVRSLAARFDMTPADLSSAIDEARRAYQALPVAHGATVQVFYRPGEVVFSCYRFDRTAVMTLYTHQRVRTGVPTIVCRDGGSLYNFIRAEFRALQAQSTAAPIGPTSASPLINLNEVAPPVTPAPANSTGGTP